MHSSLEVITPAACLDLTILETAKMELGIPPSDTSKDDKITTLIKQASSIVADYCNQVFGAEEVLETFWSDAPSSSYERSFMLSREPIISIDSVVIDGQTIDPTNYRMATDGHLHRLDTVGLTFWCLTSTAEIHYTAGYVLLDDLPYGIERAALSLIKEYYAGFGQNPRVRSEEIPGLRRVDYQIGGGFAAGSGSLPPEVTALLWPYRRLAFA
jgi:hypothetical protein